MSTAGYTFVSSSVKCLLFEMLYLTSPTKSSTLDICSLVSVVTDKYFLINYIAQHTFFVSDFTESEIGVRFSLRTIKYSSFRFSMSISESLAVE